MKIFYVSVLNTNLPADQQLTLHLFRNERDARTRLTSILASYGVPYEVWRALHRILADEALPYMRQGIYITMGEKQLFLSPSSWSRPESSWR